MRQSLTSIASASKQPKWVITLVLIVGVLTLMAMRIIDPDMGLAFLGGQAAGVGAGSMK